MAKDRSWSLGVVFIAGIIEVSSLDSSLPWV